MLFTLIHRYRNGVLLTRDELQAEEKHTGTLLIEDWIEGNLFGRPVRVARLHTRLGSVQAASIRPLFEPVILKMTESRIALQGHEVCSDAEGIRHFLQVWLLKPANQRPEQEDINSSAA